MTAMTRTLLETALRADETLSVTERSALQAALTDVPPDLPATPLLVTQKNAAELLDVSRVTIWRMAKDGLLHPVELLPGTWRYRYAELAALARPAGQPKTNENP